jgi:hypothetical protein
MPEPPRLSGRDVFDWLQAFGFLIVVVQILRSSDPLSFKIAVVGIPFAFLYTTVVLHVGRKQERRRIEMHRRKSRRERGDSEERQGPRKVERYRDAA